MVELWSGMGDLMFVVWNLWQVNWFLLVLVSVYVFSRREDWR